MQIILLERVENLGNLGEEVNVKGGFARNFLLPKGKALVANAKNRTRFEAQRATIEARNEKACEQAHSLGKALDGNCFIIIRRASTTGQLYGSVTVRDIVAAAKEGGHEIRREQIYLNAPIKTLGVHDVVIRLHAEVRVNISVNIAQSMDEAERQAVGEAIDDPEPIDPDPVDDSDANDAEAIRAEPTQTAS